MNNITTTLVTNITNLITTTLVYANTTNLTANTTLVPLNNTGNDEGGQLDPETIATICYGGLTVLLNIGICIFAARDVRRKVKQQKQMKQSKDTMDAETFWKKHNHIIADALENNIHENKETHVQSFNQENIDTKDIILGGDTDNETDLFKTNTIREDDETDNSNLDSKVKKDSNKTKRELLSESIGKDMVKHDINNILDDEESLLNSVSFDIDESNEDIKNISDTDDSKHSDNGALKTYDDIPIKQDKTINETKLGMESVKIKEEQQVLGIVGQVKALFKGVMSRYNIYVSVLVHLWDTATDIGVIVGWSKTAELKLYDFSGNDSNTLWYALWSILFMSAYRIFGAVSVYGTLGLGACILQLLDFLMLRELYETYTDPDLEPTVHLQMLRRLEAVFEAAPQALVQLVFLIQVQFAGSGQQVSWVNLMSIGLSAFSIGSAIVKDDAWKFGGSDSDWNTTGRTKKWWTRFSFRLFEVVSRLSALTVLWLCTNVVYTLIFLAIQFIFFGFLYTDGRLGNEFANVMSILIAYPNLSIREPYNDLYIYIKMIGYTTLWTLFSDLLPPIDTQDLHYLSRSFENSLIVIASLWWRSRTENNNFIQSIKLNDLVVIFGFIAIASGISCSFIYFTRVKPQIINVQNLNLDIWGVLKRADDPDNVDILQKFIKRAPHSINEYRRRDGFVPLMQCTVKADFTVLKWFLYGPPAWKNNQVEQNNLKWKAPNIYHRDRQGRTVLWYIIMNRKISCDDIYATHNDDIGGHERKKLLLWIKSKDYERRVKWFKIILKFSYKNQTNPLDYQWRELEFKLIKVSKKKVDYTLLNSQSKFYDNYIKHWAKKYENVTQVSQNNNSTNNDVNNNMYNHDDNNKDNGTLNGLRNGNEVEKKEDTNVKINKKEEVKSIIELQSVLHETGSFKKVKGYTPISPTGTQTTNVDSNELKFAKREPVASKYRTYESKHKMKYKVKLHYIGRDGTGFVSKHDINQRNPFKKWWKKKSGNKTHASMFSMDSLLINTSRNTRKFSTVRESIKLGFGSFQTQHIGRTTSFFLGRHNENGQSIGNIIPYVSSNKNEKNKKDVFEMLDDDADDNKTNSDSLHTPTPNKINNLLNVDRGHVKDVTGTSISLNNTGGITPFNDKTPITSNDIMKNNFPNTEEVKVKVDISQSSHSITKEKIEEEMKNNEINFILGNIAHSIRDIAEHTVTKLTLDEHSRIYVSLKDKIGQTALHFAAIKRDDDFVGLLLQMGVNPNIKDIYGNTPMHYALKTDWIKDRSTIFQNAYNKHSILYKEYKERVQDKRVHGKEVRRGAMQVVDRFIDWNVYCRIKKKKIAAKELETAIESGKNDTDIIQYHKHFHDYIACDWSIKNNLDHDIFLVACVLDEPKYLIQFCESKIKLDTKDIEGNNLLSFCIINERYKCINAILDKNLLEYDVLWYENDYYQTSFEIAIEYREWWLLPLILKQTYNEEGLIRILTKASLYGNNELIDIIFQHCGNYIKLYSTQIIETAIKNNKIYVIKLLANKKPSIFKNTNARGESSAFHCVKFGQLTILKYLIENIPYYIDLKAQNHYGMNLFQIAYLYHQRHCYKYLKKTLPIWEEKCIKLFGDEWEYNNQYDSDDDDDNDYSDDTNEEQSVTYSTYSVRAIP